jgi:predicted site-specific integrase-resolvase
VFVFKEGLSMQEMLSGEVAKRLSVHPITVARMAEAGRLKFRINQYGWKLFRTNEVEQVAKARTKTEKRVNASLVNT